MSVRRKLTAVAQPFTCHQDAALAILAEYVLRGDSLPPRTASFLGGCCSYPTLTPRMEHWLDVLLRKEDMPPIEKRK